MEVIKAHESTQRFIDKNDYLVDNMNEAYFMVNAVQRWLAMQLNGLAFIFILLITLLCVGRVSQHQYGFLFYRVDYFLYISSS